MSERASERLWLCWKMSVDLSPPAFYVENVDVIDGYVVHSFRSAQTRRTGPERDRAGRERVQRMLDLKWGRYASGNPVDLGTTLWTAKRTGRCSSPTAQRLALLRPHNGRRTVEAQFADVIFKDGHYGQSRPYRVAFRGFGSGLGIRCHIETRDNLQELSRGK